MKQIIKKIVLTGGPCAGKTTAISWIANNFTKYGWKVMVIAETATELITGGACPWEVEDSVRFQAALYQMLKAKETAYENIAGCLKDEKILIVCDRGALDAEAYMSDNQIVDFHKHMQVDMTKTQMMNDYDAVFHLVTAAKGAVVYYTTENNEARKESPELAIALDDKTIAAWTGHPHLRIVDNATDFKEKMQRLMGEIAACLGEPDPFEIEKKFVIEYPNIDYLESLPNCQRVEILQFYLKSNDDEEIRVRQRGKENDSIYTKTIKRKVSEFVRVEKEKKISKSEYVSELMNIDTNKSPIRKTRYCLSHLNTYLEIDVYDFWQDKAILEIELASENSEYVIPEFINVVKDVTEDPAYKNISLSQWINHTNNRKEV